MLRILICTQIGNIMAHGLNDYDLGWYQLDVS
jgi:hypothetical protein